MLKYKWWWLIKKKEANYITKTYWVRKITKQQVEYKPSAKPKCFTYKIHKC